MKMNVAILAVIAGLSATILSGCVTTNNHYGRDDRRGFYYRDYRRPVVVYRAPPPYRYERR